MQSHFLRVRSAPFQTKITAASMWKNRTCLAINGPTTGGADNLPPFSWAAFPNTPHVGLPEVYNFTFAPMVPKW